MNAISTRSELSRHEMESGRADTRAAEILPHPVGWNVWGACNISAERAGIRSGSVGARLRVRKGGGDDRRPNVVDPSGLRLAFERQADTLLDRGRCPGHQQRHAGTSPESGEPISPGRIGSTRGLSARKFGVQAVDGLAECEVSENFVLVDAAPAVLSDREEMCLEFVRHLRIFAKRFQDFGHQVGYRGPFSLRRDRDQRSDDLNQRFERIEIPLIESRGTAIPAIWIRENHRSPILISTPIQPCIAAGCFHRGEQLSNLREVTDSSDNPRDAVLILHNSNVGSGANRAPRIPLFQGFVQKLRWVRHAAEFTAAHGSRSAVSPTKRHLTKRCVAPQTPVASPK